MWNHQKLESWDDIVLEFLQAGMIYACDASRRTGRTCCEINADNAHLRFNHAWNKFPSRLEAIACRLESIAIRIKLEAIHLVASCST